MTKSIAYALDNTGTIYADVKSCSLNLRVGILQELDEEGDISTRYESEFGFEEYYDDKPLTVRVSFAYETNPYFSEEQIVKFNKKTRYNEERYTQVIEDYINEGLYKSLHELDEYNNVLVPKSRKWKEEWHSDRIPAEWEKNR